MIGVYLKNGNNGKPKEFKRIFGTIIYGRALICHQISSFIKA
jgi:hypothetical protein